MGYNRQWEGALTPSKPIPDDLADKINGMSLDVNVVRGNYTDGDSDGAVGDVVPSFRIMTGSSVAEDILRVQRLLTPLKIKLSGEITWSGDSGDDFGKLEVVRGKVYVRRGEITYGKRTPVSLERWAVRVLTRFKRWPKVWKTCGWVVTSDRGGETSVAWSQSDTPIYAAARFASEDDAWVAAHNHTYGKHKCEVVKTEVL